MVDSVSSTNLLHEIHWPCWITGVVTQPIVPAGTIELLGQRTCNAINPFEGIESRKVVPHGNHPINNKAEWNEFPSDL